MKKRHLHNCWACGHQRTTQPDADGVEQPCVPWCQPYQDEWLDDEPGINPKGVIVWLESVGADLDNMPPKRTLVPCPQWAKLKKR